ncbi:MAG TPA: hypothetical protein VD971_02520 [Phycisphaerales bacterium]|nr:hypothetical protein [Phycisphaerales bacterium]
MKAKRPKLAPARRRPTWRRTLAVWALATGALMLTTLLLAWSIVCFTYADISVILMCKYSSVCWDIPWSPDLATPPFHYISDRGNFGIGGVPDVTVLTSKRSGTKSVFVFIPNWLLAAFGGGGVAWVWRIVPRRNRLGVYPCGYSLAGLKDAVVCPECGAKSTA